MVDPLNRCPICGSVLNGGDVFGHLADGRLCHAGCIPMVGPPQRTKEYLIGVIKDWWYWKNTTAHPEAEKHSHLVRIETEMSQIAREA